MKKRQEIDIRKEKIIQAEPKVVFEALTEPEK
jgi:uncharacterized protein YndB with AHSA1/START domain